MSESEGSASGIPVSDIPGVDRRPPSEAQRNWISKDTRKKLERAEKQRKALELRLAGLTYTEIGERLGVSRGMPQRWVTSAIKAHTQEPAEQVRALELARLDRYAARLEPQLSSGNPNHVRLAIDRLLKIQERRTAYLGLDAPQRRVLDVVTDESIARATRELEAKIAEAERQIVDAEVVPSGELESGD